MHLHAKTARIPSLPRPRAIPSARAVAWSDNSAGGARFTVLGQAAGADQRRTSAEDGNAALVALALLGTTPALVWYLPDLARS